MSIKRVDTARGHHYIDTDTGERIPGVTTILGNGIPKPALINWAASATIDYALDNWEALNDKAISVRQKELSGARYAVKDAAANRGTAVHALAEKLVHGEAVPVPDELAGHVASYVRFLDEFDVQPVMVERTVYSAQHHYCGTLDLIAELADPDGGEPATWLLDIKTNRSGIFGETALQLAAYRYADSWIDDDGEEQFMPEVDHVGAVHVRADGYSLVPVVAEELQFRQFLYAAQVAKFLDTSRDLVGDPIVWPQASTYRLVRDE